MDCDVCIVGGGPAGAVLAAQLANRGHAVAVIERSAHDDPPRGETLHSGARDVLDHLGLTAAIGARPLDRSLVRWGTPSPVERVFPVPQLAVMRPQLDATLLDLARAAGARVLQPARARRANLGDAGWTIEIEHSPPVRARYLVDASGRSRWMRGVRTRTSERTFAMRGMWCGDHLPSESRVEALDDGWIWGAPVGPGWYAAVVVVDPAPDLSASRYTAALRASQLFRELPSHASPAPGFAVCDTTSHAPPAGCADRLIRIGDASYSLDPLSSAGLHTALGSALHATAALHTLLLHPDRTPIVEQFYEDARRAEMLRHTTWSSALYATGGSIEHACWQRRARSVPIALAFVAFDPSCTHVALAPEVVLEDVPCIANDEIEMRPGVRRSPDRSFVWSDGILVAPLLATLRSGPQTPHALIASWHDVSLARRRTLLASLLSSGVVVPVHG